jgi:hypothetical protein
MARAPRRVVGNLAEDGLMRSLGPYSVHERLEFTLRKPIRMVEAPHWICRRVARGLVERDVRLAAESAHTVFLS